MAEFDVSPSDESFDSKVQLNRPTRASRRESVNEGVVNLIGRIATVTDATHRNNKLILAVGFVGALLILATFCINVISIEYTKDMETSNGQLLDKTTLAPVKVQNTVVPIQAARAEERAAMATLSLPFLMAKKTVNYQKASKTGSFSVSFDVTGHEYVKCLGESQSACCNVDGHAYLLYTARQDRVFALVQREAVETVLCNDQEFLSHTGELIVRIEQEAAAEERSRGDMLKSFGRRRVVEAISRKLLFAQEHEVFETAADAQAFYKCQGQLNGRYAPGMENNTLVNFEEISNEKMKKDYLTAFKMDATEMSGACDGTKVYVEGKGFVLASSVYGGNILRTSQYGHMENGDLHDLEHSGGTSELEFMQYCAKFRSTNNVRFTDPKYYSHYIHEEWDNWKSQATMVGGVYQQFAGTSDGQFWRRTDICDETLTYNNGAPVAGFWLNPDETILSPWQAASYSLNSGDIVADVSTTHYEEKKEYSDSLYWSPMTNTYINGAWACVMCFACNRPQFGYVDGTIGALSGHVNNGMFEFSNNNACTRHLVTINPSNYQVTMGGMMDGMH